MTPTGDMLAAASAVPVRTCIGCRAKLPQGRLLRFVRQADGRVTPANVTRELCGRSTYLCPRRACLAQALKRRAFTRAFAIESRGRTKSSPSASRAAGVIDVDADALWAATAEQLRREIELLGRTSDNPHTHLRRRGLEQLLSELSSQPRASQPQASQPQASPLQAQTPREGGAPSHG